MTKYHYPTNCFGDKCYQLVAKLCKYLGLYGHAEDIYMVGLDSTHLVPRTRYHGDVIMDNHSFIAWKVGRGCYCGYLYSERSPTFRRNLIVVPVNSSLCYCVVSDEEIYVMHRGRDYFRNCYILPESE